MTTAMAVTIFSFFAIEVAVGLEEKPLQMIPAGQLFSVAVDSPGGLTVCADRLWVYSVSKASLIEIQLRTGSILGFHSLGELSLAKDRFEVTALTCRANQLLLLANEKDQRKRARIYRIKPAGSYSVLPQRGRFTDLFCRDRECIALNQKIYQSLDLESWKLIDLPPEASERRSDPESKAASAESNPFRFWQEDLTLAQPFLSRGAISDQGSMAIIDFFKAKIELLTILQDLSTKSEATSSGPRSWRPHQQWGRFGAWEGSFIAPQFISYLKGRRLIISDGKLRSLFLFTEQGNYLGMLADSSGLAISPKQLLGLASDGAKIYFSDFGTNRVAAWQVSDEAAVKPSVNILEIRQNLLRQAAGQNDKPPETCLHCHDGLFSSQVSYFAAPHKDHKVNCTFCHSAHHDSKLPHQMVKPTLNLCEFCHSDRVATATNHIWQAQKKGGTCSDCHRYHSANLHLLREQPPNLCVQCHLDKKRSHRDVARLLWHDSAKKLVFAEGRIECRTCHRTHLNWRSGNFLIERDQVRIFCALCHGEKSEVLYRTFHRKTEGQ